jgi:SAM-dependent methyltransferase
MKTLDVPFETVQAHFTARAPRYDGSSRWCTDAVLLDRMVALVDPYPDCSVLDVATGTGLVARALVGRVGRITGLDVNAAMANRALVALDVLVEGSAEAMPLPSGSFDRVICRQGIQFMDARRAVAEMVRVTRPGGRVVLVDLCAWGEQDEREVFEILRLRNPARRNFFVRGDTALILGEAGCTAVEVHDHESEEDIDVWTDHGAIDELRREAIREVYRHASDAFRRLHEVRLDDGRIVDRMLFGIAVGQVS